MTTKELFEQIPEEAKELILFHLDNVLHAADKVGAGPLKSEFLVKEIRGEVDDIRRYFHLSNINNPDTVKNMEVNRLASKAGVDVENQ